MILFLQNTKIKHKSAYAHKPRNLKTQQSQVILRLSASVKLGQGNTTKMITSSFLKSFVKMFSVHTKTQRQRSRDELLGSFSNDDGDGGDEAG